MNSFINKVFNGDALDLLRVIATTSLDAVITDAMFGTANRLVYDWGREPSRGDPDKHWQYHEPFYRECLRVLRPGGVLAWGQGFKFIPHFDRWFGPHRVWSPLCTAHGLNVVPNAWVVQTKERRPIEHPNRMVVYVDRKLFVPLKKLHPCPKPVEELAFLIEALTKPGQIILDCFCGVGSTLVAAQQLGRRWIGCDKSRTYCQAAMWRLANPGKPIAIPKPDGQSTPQWLFDILNEQVRALTGQGFQLDAAACEWNAKCARYFDEEMDALKQDWSAWATVFCNPPFSAQLISKFAAKALEAADKGSTVVLLLPSWPGYPWFQELKRRGRMQDIIGPVAFALADGGKVLLNNGYKTTAIVVATLGPKVTAGTNGEPIAKPGVVSRHRPSKSRQDQAYQED